MMALIKRILGKPGSAKRDPDDERIRRSLERTGRELDALEEQLSILSGQYAEHTHNGQTEFRHKD